MRQLFGDCRAQNRRDDDGHVGPVAKWKLPAGFFDNKEDCCERRIERCRLALAEPWGHALSCAYFNLPKAVGQTGLAFWPTDGEALQESAVACARGAAAAIRAGEFWPPIEQRGPYDGEWDGLFLQGVQASVVENWGQDSEVRS